LGLHVWDGGGVSKKLFSLPQNRFFSELKPHFRTEELKNRNVEKNCTACPRFAEHREHFYEPGHSLSDMTLTVLERVKSSDDMYRKEREKYFIRKFNTYYKGLNRQP
jgi:hypothetical protein